ncbi:MAG TPA: hypoxanthine phosphoribosyltransferase [Bacteroidales bacterium]|nr:hypoxanthine phosphoribosyltransferase [Bacteroidales bacterium]HOE04647.1 hypoxanthine phosphoribosyltransferase [Bacteroidales bacterium]HQL69285.1 hypoxanthine phosphoribosyltransferase [Bacteroidales bacterium]
MRTRNQKSVKLYDKEFVSFINGITLAKAIRETGLKMQADLEGEDVVALCVLNGSFMFAGELFRHFELPCKISFIKLSSYEGTGSTGCVQEIIGLKENITGKTVVVVEDIVDTGETITKLVEDLKKHNPKQIRIATMLLKPDAYKKDIPIDYVALSIPDKFVVGFGLDYNGLGRNLKDLYQILTD